MDRQAPARSLKSCPHVRHKPASNGRAPARVGVEVTTGVPLYVRSAVAIVPSTRLPVEAIIAGERSRYDRQCSALSPALRERLEHRLGIGSISVHEGPPSRLGVRAAWSALGLAEIAPSEVGVVVDFSTMYGDRPGIWSLANVVQGSLEGCEGAALSVSGSGCAGLHLALRVSAALLAQETSIRSALLVASDCVPRGSRCCLPVSIMGDAASALVLSTEPPSSGPAVVLRAVATTTMGRQQEVITAHGNPPVIEVDGGAFEAAVLPLHFFLCHRLLAQVLALSGKRLEDLDALVYPNTTALDRTSITRALGLRPDRLWGPGPDATGHAFANDMIINLPDFSRADAPEWCALLAAGSGFTWGAALVQRIPPP